MLVKCIMKTKYYLLYLVLWQYSVFYILHHQVLSESIYFIGLLTSTFIFYAKIIKYTLPYYKCCFVLNVNILVAFSHPKDILFLEAIMPMQRKHSIQLSLPLIYIEK